MPTDLDWSLAMAYAPSRAADAPPRDTLFGRTSIDLGRIHDDTSSGEATDQGPDVDLELRSKWRYGSDFSDGPGRMNVVRGGWDARLGWKTAKNQGFTINMHTEASFYDFSGATGLVPGSGTGKPLDDVYETSLGTTMCVRNSGRASWFTSAELTLSGEDHAAPGDALTVGVVAGIRYQANEDIAFQTGLAALTMLEDQPWVFPYVGFDWRISERWRLGTQGSRIRLAVDLNDKWTLFGEAAYEVRQYRLNDDSPLPHGAMRDQEIDLGGGLDWRPHRGVNIGLQTGLVGWQQLEFFARDGDKVSETESKPAPFAKLVMKFSF